jgi:DNA-directed RNA polymerase II subunit RPB9
LYYACRNCAYRERAESAVVYEHHLKSTKMDESGHFANLSSDPTLPRVTAACAKCNFDVAVYFQSQSRRADTKMTLYYVCANPTCGYMWS